jgi:hypothetical protein
MALCDDTGHIDGQFVWGVVPAGAAPHYGYGIMTYCDYGI